MIKIILPSGDSVSEQISKCIEILSEIDNIPLNDKIILDMTKLRWILPCSAAILSNKIYSLVASGRHIIAIPPELPNVRKYLEIIGFPFGSNNERSTLSPIYHFTSHPEKGIGYSIEKEINKIYKILKSNFPPEVFDGAFQILTELSDNISEHSLAPNGSIMAQYYKGKNFIDICIIDNGISIPGAYTYNGMQFDNDCHAIHNSLRGISTKKGETNRGTGLATSRNLVLNGFNGEFHIISRNGRVTLKKDSTESTSIKIPFPGTLVYCRFSIPDNKVSIYDYIQT